MLRSRIAGLAFPLLATVVANANANAAPSAAPGGTAVTTSTAAETAASIRAAVMAALQPRLADLKDATAEVGAIDARLHLPSCPAIAVDLPSMNSAAMTAKVDCQSPAWTIYVPVRLHAWTEAVVAAANLVPGSRLTAAELSHGRVDVFSASGGLVTETAAAEGKVLRVGVPAGGPILASFLEMPLVVHRGQKVLLTLNDSAMTIRNTVVALEDGRVGDRIAVQNAETSKTVHAKVNEDGTVEIKF